MCLIYVSCLTNLSRYCHKKLIPNKKKNKKIKKNSKI